MYLLATKDRKKNDLKTIFCLVFINETSSELKIIITESFIKVITFFSEMNLVLKN